MLCRYDSEVRALTTFLPGCTNMRTLYYERVRHGDISESVEEEMCGVMRKLSEREGIQAQKLRRIVRVDWNGREVDSTEQVRHLLSALQ